MHLLGINPHLGGQQDCVCGTKSKQTTVYVFIVMKEHDVSSLYSTTFCNSAQSVIQYFFDLSEKVKHVPEIYFPYWKTVKTSSTTALPVTNQNHDFNKAKRLLCEQTTTPIKFTSASTQPLLLKLRCCRAHGKWCLSKIAKKT